MERNRYFLKDSVRLELDFSQTAQNRGVAPPPLQKPCLEGIPRIALPDGNETLERLGGKAVGECILQRKSVRKYTNVPLTLDELSMLLWATQGVRKVLGPECAMRTVPSAGARHTFETYLAVSRVDSLQPGLYRYLPFDNALAQLRLDDNIGYEASMVCFGQKFIASAAVTFFWTTLPERMEWRYDLAAHKVIALDAGHVCQNLYLACQSIGAGTCAIAAYDQAGCDKLLGIDGKDEFTLYIAPVGKR